MEGAIERAKERGYSEKDFELDLKKSSLEVRSVYSQLKLERQRKAQNESGSNRPVLLDLPARIRLLEDSRKQVSQAKERDGKTQNETQEEVRPENNPSDWVDHEDQYEENMRAALIRSGLLSGEKTI